MLYPVSCLTLRISLWLLIIAHQLLGYSNNWGSLFLEGCHSCSEKPRKADMSFYQALFTHLWRSYLTPLYGTLSINKTSQRSSVTRPLTSCVICYSLVWGRRETGVDAQELTGHNCLLAWVQALLFRMQVWAQWGLKADLPVNNLVWSNMFWEARRGTILM